MSSPKERVLNYENVLTLEEKQECLECLRETIAKYGNHKPWIKVLDFVNRKAEGSSPGLGKHKVTKALLISQLSSYMEDVVGISVAEVMGERITKKRSLKYLVNDLLGNKENYSPNVTSKQQKQEPIVVTDDEDGPPYTPVPVRSYTEVFPLSSPLPLRLDDSPPQSPSKARRTPEELVMYFVDLYPTLAGQLNFLIEEQIDEESLRSPECTPDYLKKFGVKEGVALKLLAIKHTSVANMNKPKLSGADMRSIYQEGWSFNKPLEFRHKANPLNDEELRHKISRMRDRRQEQIEKQAKKVAAAEAQKEKEAKSKAVVNVDVQQIGRTKSYQITFADKTVETYTGSTLKGNLRAKVKQFLDSLEGEVQTILGEKGDTSESAIHTFHETAAPQDEEEPLHRRSRIRNGYIQGEWRSSGRKLGSDPLITSQPDDDVLAPIPDVSQM